MSVNLAGIPLATPVVLLSGCVAFGEDLFHIKGFPWSAVGAICLKGTTLEPRAGNAPHRVAETPSGLLNAIGLQNPGARAVVETILPRLTGRLAPWPVQLIANIAGSTVEEYGEVARIFDDSPVAGIEINISCPNVKKGGAAFGADPEVAARVVAEVRKATSKPLFTKLSPNVTDIRLMARVAMEAGSDGLSVINTLMGMAIDIRNRQAILGNVQGGLSGPAIKPIALLKVWQVWQELREKKVPIIGQGGIASARDGIEFFLAGASAIGLGTALFRQPLLPGKVVSGMRRYLEEEGVSRVSDLTGTLGVGGA
ncbi:MAG: dihydroorotate dehydrogenase [Magnetococcales bacterium]|nr:dihydroorotate dehydrogenase [Magnetococcales bacterium]